MRPLQLLDQITQIIDDKKGENCLVLDVQGLSSITDYVVIAEGGADRHVIAIAKAIIDKLKEEGAFVLHSEGLKVGDWVVLDYGPVMVHLFAPGLRQKYCLERLWPESKLV